MKNPQLFVPLVFVLGAAMHPVVIASDPATSVQSHPMIGEQAPAFELEEVDGGSTSLEGLRGRWVVIHFGTSW